MGRVDLRALRVGEHLVHDHVEGVGRRPEVREDAGDVARVDGGVQQPVRRQSDLTSESAQPLGLRERDEVDGALRVVLGVPRVGAQRQCRLVVRLPPAQARSSVASAGRRKRDAA